MIIIQFLIAIFITVLSWCWFYWWPRRQLWTLARTVPGPPGYPVIGNVLLHMGKTKEFIPTVMRIFDEYGPIVRMWLGPRLYFYMKDPDDIQRVLGNPKIRNRDWWITKSMSPFLGRSLFTLRGDQWKLHRRIITPTFHFKILESYVEVFERISKTLVEKVIEYDGKSFNVHDILTLCSLDSFCETSFGTVVNSLAIGKHPFAECIEVGKECIFKRCLRPWLFSDFVYNYIFKSRRAIELKKTFDEFGESVIAQKLAEHRRGVRSPGITTASNKKVSSFLDVLIEASEAENSLLSPEEMRDEVMTMAAAGVETSSTAMSFFLILVALHPEIQADLHHELDQVFGMTSSSATPGDLQQLCVMERCIKESLRLIPTVPFLPREICEDLKLPSGHVLPANSSAAIIVFATHRDARYFPEPLKFWPDRWLPENATNIHPYAYLPFSAGPRNCVGQKYAYWQMKSVLSRLLRRYRVTTPLTIDDVNKLDVSLSISMDAEVKNFYHIQLHER